MKTLTRELRKLSGRLINLKNEHCISLQMAQKGSSARICCLFSPPHFLYTVSRIFCKTYHALTHTQQPRPHHVLHPLRE